MRAVVQRVSAGSVSTSGKKLGEINKGLVVFVGFKEDDSEADLNYLTEKIINLRIFEDEAGKMNLSPLDTKADLLVISQFTLYGDVRRGRRPDFTSAAKPEKAKELYQEFVKILKNSSLKVETGEFGAMMQIDVVNDGPVTILLDSQKEF